MVARRSFRRAPGRPARPMDWENARTLANLNGTGIICNYALPPSELREQYTDPTLIALRVWGQFRQTTTPGTSQFAAIGMIAWTDANDLVPSDCPGPLSNGDMDWIVRYVVPIWSTSGTLIIAPVTFDIAHSIKSKRRLGSDKGLLVVFENAAVASVDALFDWRMLIKE